MTTPSLWRSIGLSASVSIPIFQGSTFLYTLKDEITGYSHKKSAQGGWIEATLTLNCSQVDLEDWFELGIGRDIEIYDSSANCIFNGFVDIVDISVGGLSQSRGPLSSIANRVSVIYSTIDTSVDPPILGVRTRTSYNSDLSSQSKYGVITKLLSVGGVTESNALRYRDAYLRAFKDPRVSGSLSPRVVDPVITLRLKGYYEYLKFNPYNYKVGGLTSVSSKLTQIINSDPNSILTIGSIAPNPLQVPQWEDEDRSEESLVKTLVSLGDSSNERYIFKVLANRKVYYYKAPPPYDCRYVYSITDNQLLESSNQLEVEPWNLEPGEWVFTKDWLLGRGTDSLSEMEVDPRYFFIEEVQYTAPWSWSTVGSQKDKLRQIIAKLQVRGN